MARTLDVYLHRHLSGHLVQDDHGEIRFSYAESWLGDPTAIALSNSLPLRKEPFKRKECRGFFGGILPEEGKREIIGRNLGISPKNDFAMLEQIGGECAGAVTFMPAGTSLPEREDDYRSVTDKELADILKMLPLRPLMAGEDGIRLSLAGAQDKIAVSVANGKISIPLGGAPSTHILKPAIAHFEGTVFNEALCMNLARAIGLPAAPVQIGNAEGIDYLLVERYDRKIVQARHGGPHHTERLHQEDFCQALGIVSERKYQNEGGPSLKQCFDLVREVSSAPVLDLQNLLDAVILNFLIGNHDAHGKNFSLTYQAGTVLGGSEKRFAPVYDILCTVYYPELASKMAMKIGGEYDSRKIRPQDFERLAEEAGLAKPMLKRRVSEVAESILTILPEVTTEHPIALDIAKLIRGRCERTLTEFKK
jgi:serine/threonine-protein kinase HipA